MLFPELLERFLGLPYIKCCECSFKVVLATISISRSNIGLFSLMTPLSGLMVKPPLILPP